MEQTLPLMLQERARTIPAVVAQYAKDAAGQFHPKTYRQFYDEIGNAASGLLELGAKRGYHIGIISDNRQEWMVTDFAVLSIGAGAPCDGQLLIVSDLIGQFQAFTPKFVKKYANVAEVITSAMKEYVREVKEGKFPTEEHVYKMVDGEEEKFLKMLK